MTIIRTLAFTSFALVASVAGASASTGYASTQIPPVNVYSETESSFSMPGFNFFGFGSGPRESAYTVYNKAPHNGFDPHGNGVNPPIGPITD